MPRERPYTVRELVGELQRALWDIWGHQWVVGELGRWSQAASGHVYGTLVEGPDAVSFTIMRNEVRRLRWKPKEGELVSALGRLEVFRGQLTLRVRAMEPVGAGARARALEELKRRLHEEGLFAPERKRRLPRLPRTVGVVTSARGAALQDFLTVLKRRMPSTTVVLASCRVQGEGAEHEIVQALRRIVLHGQAEVVVVTRGGGSAEDLWAFQTEAVVRAVAACPLPVVSAVGHEVDVTLCDLAADLRVATPSAAAERIVPDRQELRAEVRLRSERLVAALSRQLAEHRARVRRQKLVHPGERLVAARRRADSLQERLVAAGPRAVSIRRRQLAAATGRLDALSPLAVLGRGYAIALHDGRAVKDAAALSVGDDLELRLHEGAADVRVVAIREG